MNKVLLIFPERVGDTLFITPAIQQLKIHRPDLELNALAMTNVSAKILSNNLAFHHIYIAEQTPFNTICHNYDFILVIRNTRNIEKYVSDCKVSCIETKPVDKHWTDYACQQFSTLFDYQADPPGNYVICPQAIDFNSIDTILTKAGVEKGQSLIGLHLGTHRLAIYGTQFSKKFFRWKLSGKGKKVWSIRYAKELIHQLQQQYPQLKIILTGTESEQFIAKHFKKSTNVINLLGKTDILELAALMTRLKLFISNDTGPLHVACAMDVPLVGLYGKTNPNSHGPRPCAPHRVVINKPSMEAILPIDVYRAAVSLMEKI